MVSPLRPAGARGLTPPAFLAGKRSRGRARGWWSGLNGRGKAVTYTAACVAIALLVVLVVSASVGHGATPVTKHPPQKTSIGPLSSITTTITNNLEALRLSILSYRLKVILGKVTATAPELGQKLTELSRVVQGGRCQVLIASAAPFDLSADSSQVEPPLDPTDPEQVWRYANRLSDTYLPRFRGFLKEIQSARNELAAVGIPAPLKPPDDLLLESCDLQLEASRRCVRGLEYLRDCNEMTVGEASELVGSAVGLVNESTARLGKAICSLSRGR